MIVTFESTGDMVIAHGKAKGKSVSYYRVGNQRQFKFKGQHSSLRLLRTLIKAVDKENC